MVACRTLIAFVLTVAWSLAAAAHVAAQGCAMCGSSFGQNDPSVNAFRVSILFMMAVPYAILTVVGLWLYTSYRRARREPPTGRVVPFR